MVDFEKLLKLLPAIYQAEIVESEVAEDYLTTRETRAEIRPREALLRRDPLSSILAIFEDRLRQIKNTRDAFTEYLDPDTVPAGLNEGEPDFLSWLASWVVVDLDETWFGRTPDERVPQREWEEINKRQLVEMAAELYRTRGTKEGLKRLLQAFYRIGIDIEEWAWPRGMVIGRSSSITVDSFILDKPNPDLSNCFTVIWKPTDAERLEMDLLRVVRWFDVNLDSGAAKLKGKDEEPKDPGKKVRIGFWKAKNSNTTAQKTSDEEDFEDEFRMRSEKFRHLLDKEKPAHTLCYLGIEPPKPVPQEIPVKMIIKKQSTIGTCFVGGGM